MMEIKEAQEAVASEEEGRKSKLQAMLDSAFESDHQRRATAQAALRAIEHGVDILKRFGILLEVRLPVAIEVKPETPARNVPARLVPRKEK